MIRVIDSALPGASGLQLPTEQNGIRLYLPNCRMERCPTEEERKKYYEDKLNEFKNTGGSLSELKVLTPKIFASLEEITKVEYVVRANDEIWITTGSAGHILLGGGEAVQSAGQVLIVKNKIGKVILLILSNASGNYKPDLLAVDKLAERFFSEFGVPIRKIIVTKGEPLSAQTVKVLLKGKEVPQKDRDLQLKDMLAQSEIIMKQPVKSLANAIQMLTPCNGLH
jgi:hypothetical protein